MIQELDRRISIAPMIDYTHRHFRYFFRLLSKKVLLYTEMITSNALLHSNKELLLNHSEEELPVAFQLGGSCPKDLAQSVSMVEQAGFSEVNINLGCPSSRVQEGAFGAILMKDKELAVSCFKAMIDASNKIPVTAKCRIGVDEFDSDEFLFEFIEALRDAGCNVFIVHARIAYLKGLSPKENRTIPPLNYDRVLRLKKVFSDCQVILNGGLDNFEQLDKYKSLDGLMFGRKATQDPFYFSKVDSFLARNSVYITREKVLEDYFLYFKKEVEKKQNLNVLLKPLQGLYFGQVGTKHYKQKLMTIAQSAEPVLEYKKLLLAG